MQSEHQNYKKDINYQCAAMEIKYGGKTIFF